MKQKADPHIQKVYGENLTKKGQLQKPHEQFAQRGVKLLETKEQLANLKKESPQNVPTFIRAYHDLWLVQRVVGSQSHW